jgi:hypothetical protein
MGEDEADLALHALWTSYIVPPRKLPQVRPSKGASWRMLPKSSTPPTALTPKAMVRELRVFVVVAAILRWAQVHFKARARSGERRPTPADLLATEPLASLDFDTLTHAIRFETQRLTEQVQKEVDAFALEVMNRLDEKKIYVADSVRCGLSPTASCALNPPTIDDEARRVAELRPHLATIFETIVDVVVAPAKPSASEPGSRAAGSPEPLTIGRNRPVEDAVVADVPEHDRRSVLVRELRHHSLDHVLESREASESVVAAIVMSVAVRLGIRRCRLVHRRARSRPAMSTRGLKEPDAPSQERFVVFVDGPLACEGRGTITGPLVIDLHQRRVIRCSRETDAATGDTVDEVPVVTPAADRRAAVALLRRMQREACRSKEEVEHEAAVKAAAAAVDAQQSAVSDEATNVATAALGGFSSSHVLSGAHGVIRSPHHRQPFDHDSLKHTHAEVTSDTQHDADDDDDDDDDDDFNVGGAKDHPEPQSEDDAVATLGTLMPPKTLAAYLCSHLLVVGASQGVAEHDPATKGVGNRGPGRTARTSVNVPFEDREHTVRYVKVPDPVILADDETWRLLRSQIIFLGGLP